MKKQLMKNKNVLYYFTFCTLFFIYSCNNSPADNLSSYGGFDDIENEWLLDTSQAVQLSMPMKQEEPLLLSQFVDTSWSVPLATAEDAVVGEIDKVLVHKDVIYVLDARKAKCLLTFDLNGNFLSKIGINGTGLGRFQQPDDFCINEEEEKIVIYDDLYQKLLYYSFDGTFMEEKKVNYLLFGLESLSGNNGYVLNSFGRSNLKTTDEPHRLLKTNPTNKIHKKALAYSKKEEKLAIRLNRNEFSSFENEILYAPGFLGKIYSVRGDKIELKYQLDFGELALPKDYYEREMTQFVENFNEPNVKNYAYFSGPFFETQNHLVFNIIEGGRYYTCFYNKETDVLNYGLPKNDLSHSLETPLLLTTYQDEYLVAWGDSYYFATEKEKYGAGKSKEVIEMLDQLTPLDNPVLTFYKLKAPNLALTGL